MTQGWFLFEEDIWWENEQNTIEDIQDKTSFYLGELFSYFAEENEETLS